MISTEIHKSVLGNNILVVRAVLEEELFGQLGSFDGYSKLIDRIADKIAEGIQPDIEKQIFSDPNFKERIINEVLVKLANKFASKRIPKKKVK